MKGRLIILLGVTVAGFMLASVPSRAEGIGYSADELDLMDEWGCFPTGFKAAFEDLLNTNAAIVQAKNDEIAITAKLPDYVKKAETAETKEKELQQELDEYDHTDETDFAQLQKQMNDPNAKLEELIELAQEFVWAYPTSKHEADAQQDLQQVQQKEANQSQAEKDSEAARVAARAKLLQRVQAHELSLEEWNSFLYTLSEEDVLRYLGQPQSQSEDCWMYTGDLTQDPTTLKKVGLLLNFNAGRVVNVVVLPHAGT